MWRWEKRQLQLEEWPTTVLLNPSSEEMAIKLQDTSLSCVSHTGTWEAQGWLWCPLQHHSTSCSYTSLSSELCFKAYSPHFPAGSHFTLYCRYCTLVSTGVLLQNQNRQEVGFRLWSFLHIPWQLQALFYSQLQSALADLGAWLKYFLLHLQLLPLQWRHLHPSTGTASPLVNPDCDCFAPSQSSTSPGIEQGGKNSISQSICAFSRTDNLKWHAQIWRLLNGYSCQQELSGLEELLSEDNSWPVTKLE